MGFLWLLELSRLGRTLVGSVSSYLAQLSPHNLIVVKRAPGEKVTNEAEK